MSSPISRRDFVITTAATTAALAMLPTASATAQSKPAAQQSSPKRTLKKAVMFGMISGNAPVIEKFKVLRDLGFDGVEMDSPGKIDLDEILKAQESTGLRVHGLVDSQHWENHLNNPDEAIRKKGIDALETAIRDAHKLGSISVLLVPAVVSKQMPYDQAWKLSRQAIETVLPLASELKIKIAIENVWNGFLLSPLEAVRYVDEFQSPWIAWHFDIGNIINFGWPEQWIRILGQRITKLHIKDFSRAKRDKEGLWRGFDVQLGEGDADWPAVMNALDEIGYSNDPQGRWATAEVGGGDENRLKQIAKQMDELFAK